jgi:sulfur carrier protein ThiS
MHLEDGSSINDILIKLDIKRKVVISVNGEQVSDRHYQLNDGDEVKLFSSISGG